MVVTMAITVTAIDVNGPARVITATAIVASIMMIVVADASTQPDRHHHNDSA